MGIRASTKVPKASRPQMPGYDPGGTPHCCVWTGREEVPKICYTLEIPIKLVQSDEQVLLH
jgi:hypothetical protein